MAKLPEAKVEELAKKALERQEQFEQRSQKIRETKERKFIEAQMTPEEREAKRIQEEKKIAKKVSENNKKKMGAAITNSSPVIQNRVLKNNNLPIGKNKYKVLDYTNPQDLSLIKAIDRRYYIDNQSPTRVNNSAQHKIDYINAQNKNVEKFFNSNGTLPIYAKYVCSCCGTPKKIEEFYRTYSYAYAGQIDEVGQFHLSVCKSCANKLFYFHYYNNCDKDLYSALERTCCDLNIYWDTELVEEAKLYHDSMKSSLNVFGKYMIALGQKTVYYGKTYWDSPTRIKLIVEVPPEGLGLQLQEEGNNTDNLSSDNIANNIEEVADISNMASNIKNDNMDAPIHWNHEEARLRRRIITTLRYDPFDMYPEEEARKMYFDLDLMIDETMQEDLLKLKAAVEIVCSLHEIEKLRIRAIELEKEGAEASEIKAIMLRRKDELSQITTFAKDNGFAERYATKKAKGAGTLTGIMNEMKEKDYEPSLSNYYNVKTCEAMQEAADMMFSAMWKQLSLTDSEAWGMVQKQTNKIRQLNKEVGDLKEQIRKKEIQLKKVELEQQAKAYKAQLEAEEAEALRGLSRGG